MKILQLLFLGLFLIPKTNAQTIKHVVESKETLFSIARTYNVSVQDLASLNDSKLKEGLRIGLEIEIPNKKKTIEGNARVINAETIFHSVEAKETKYSISKKYGISVDQLESQNPEIISGLNIGTKLAINKSQIKPKTDQEELMVALADKQALQEKAKAISTENEKLKLEKSTNSNQVEILKDSLTIQKELNQKVISVNGMQVKLDDLEYKNGSSVEKLKLVLEANKNIQAVLVSKLLNLVKDMRNDVENLKKQEIADLETSQKLERSSSESFLKTNEVIQNLKQELSENRKNYTGIMNDVQRVSLETNNEYKKKARENARKPAETKALDAIKKIQSEQNQNEKLNKTLFAKIENINSERSSIIKNKIKMATFYSEESRTFDDKMALEKLKRYKKDAAISQAENKYKSVKNANTNEKKPSRTIEFQTIKNLKEVKDGFYVVQEIFTNAAERDTFVMKLIDAGNLETTFFYDVNTFSYYVYTKYFSTLSDATINYKSNENKKLFEKMKIIKLLTSE